MPHPILAAKPGETLLLLGNEAIVRGAVEAGINFVSCYPGTPSSEVPDTFFRLAPEGEYTFEYSVNEKVALEVAGGATLGGALCLCTMKHVGVNVAADPFMTLAYTGTPGGLVLLSADDPGCHSSQNEQDNRYYARLAGMPVFEPSTAQECKDMTRDALLLSRETGSPVLLRTTTRVNHLRGPVECGPVSAPQEIKGFSKNPAQFVPIPAFARSMHDRLLDRIEVLRGHAEHSVFNAVSGEGRIGVVATGISRAYLHDALLDCGLEGQIRVLELGFTAPLPEAKVVEFLTGLDKVLVAEELEPILENEIRVLAQKNNLPLTVLGKDILPRQGEFNTGVLAEALQHLSGQGDFQCVSCEPAEGLPMRPPNLCAGCPHRAAYYAARQVFGDDAIYSSDIGCYTLGIVPPLACADFLLCMGSSVSAGSGLSKATKQTVVGFIGDSTFFHSGVTGLINAVHNNHDLLLVVLDNRTTAMTGHQPNPGVDPEPLGDDVAQVDIESICRGCGVDAIRKVNPLNVSKTLDAYTELRGMKGVRVLITEEPCPLFARRVYRKKPKMTAYVEDGYDMAEGVLEKLACPAFRLCDGKMEIDELMCNGCMVCVQLSDNIKARKRGA
ncbi:indolepyruvate ferredoxin oxidoreductase alpha subunit [Paucidesulfovibrio gracilis DSM 16080]|uniref:Indolepyruvate oxidoreductase subunit IorA n=1 Tax=Paucidesulfovibrio gracilis DSM 16080 TaxID=1121449 RepID=A0A1T4W1E7_9BACT|nr:indolepyruvate ferredoxin oxidoreductase subunit alpha [Paucidesulfovibrio gracilis]SKA70959.1 indolepyruvate ferredoxin oxidoreductase alpha subunit [Paucidesulfovibrio gracilis DSM 16080]